jgi:hypothetical protein
MKFNLLVFFTNIYLWLTTKKYDFCIENNICCSKDSGEFWLYYNIIMDDNLGKSLWFDHLENSYYNCNSTLLNFYHNNLYCFKSNNKYIKWIHIMKLSQFEYYLLVIHYQLDQHYECNYFNTTLFK